MNIQMQKASEFTGEYATIQIVLPDSGRTARVEVWGPQERFGSMGAPEVNWSALGSVSAADAVAYAEAIAFAARLAPTLSGPTKEA